MVPDNNPSGTTRVLAPELASSLVDNLPFALRALLRLHQEGLGDARLLLDCQLSLVNTADATYHRSLPVASIDITPLLLASLPTTNPRSDALMGYPGAVDVPTQPVLSVSNASLVPGSETSNKIQKRRQQRALNSATGHRRAHLSSPKHIVASSNVELIPQQESMTLPPSDAALDKLVDGIWQALFSDAELDPSDFLQAGQAIADSTDLKFLGSPERNDADGADDDNDDKTIDARRLFSRINAIARQVSQVSKACRAIEIGVQARWVQCFDDRVKSLKSTSSADIAKKRAMAEACSDFRWSEKELRNKMGIWRGYQEIARHGGYVALVFAGPGRRQKKPIPAKIAGNTKLTTALRTSACASQTYTAPRKPSSLPYRSPKPRAAKTTGSSPVYPWSEGAQ